MNSWQQPVTDEPSAGTLHLLDEADRNTSYDLDDSSVSTSWEECDLSNKVPNGTKALLGYMSVTTTTDSKGMLKVRDATSSATTSIQTRMKRTQAAGFWGNPVIIKATNGKFDYQEDSTSYEIDRVRFVLWGYYL